jgi:hypothetical protein
MGAAGHPLKDKTGGYALLKPFSPRPKGEKGTEANAIKSLSHPEHDQAIKIENKIRQEQTIPSLRGTYENPEKGNSLWKRWRSSEWKRDRPTREQFLDDCEKAKQK